MAENLTSKSAKKPGPSTGKVDAGAFGKIPIKSGEDPFPADFAKLKLSVVRPVFDSVGSTLKERGCEFNISEEPAGKISIHIVPAGANKSIHPYDWFPTFSVFGAPFTKSVGFHGRNMRRNSEASSGPRGDHKLAQVNTEIVEKELMKFIGEIANW